MNRFFGTEEELESEPESVLPYIPQTGPPPGLEYGSTHAGAEFVSSDQTTVQKKRSRGSANKSLCVAAGALLAALVLAGLIAMLLLFWSPKKGTEAKR